MHSFRALRLNAGYAPKYLHTCLPPSDLALEHVDSDSLPRPLRTPTPEASCADRFIYLAVNNKAD
ncbi:MAG: hypothetical protein Greene07147_497 [Parcubacteria group bacterium Greene0714_7]|nr:MAG: hypothetical protein Greene07147_497 [Parcubacteria group bacterium Greene0714_7]